jgi:hypothetical protein
LGENKILAMGVPAHITNILQPLKSYSLVQWRSWRLLHWVSLVMNQWRNRF